MRHLFLILVSAAVLLGQSDSARREHEKPGDRHTTSPEDGLVGAWRLVSIETLRSNGEVIYPFYGKHPEGLLIYDPSGWMSVQIVSDPKPLVPKADSREVFLASTPTEKAAAADGYYAYFGTWTVDAANSTVTHHIEQSFYPGEMGESGVRRMSISGKLLTLVAKTHEMGEDHERKLVWERVQQARPSTVN
jgi:hypothetical protein